MRSVVIGAGVVGVTTAYALARDGHSVTVVDRQPNTARESSFANGGQLSFSFASPMASPELFSKIPSILLGRDTAFNLPSRFLVRHPLWIFSFVRACLPKAHVRIARDLSSLALDARSALDQICIETNIQFSRRRAGKLIVLSTESAFKAATRQFQHRHDAAVLDRDDCVTLDPSLSAVGGPFSGGIWFQDDEVGDIERFCHELAAKCRELYSARLKFSSDVTAIKKASNGELHISLSTGEHLTCDSVVVCTGADGADLLQPHGIKLPIVPVTGYSITAPFGSNPPTVAITDAENKIVCSRIGNYIRIAGFADFGQLGDKKVSNRIQSLINVSRQRFPQAANYKQLHSTWSGKRPATPDSLPIVGTTRVPGIYVNMGHGMYGWTLAPAAANRLVASLPTRAKSTVSVYAKEIL